MGFDAPFPKRGGYLPIIQHRRTFNRNNVALYRTILMRQVPPQWRIPPIFPPPIRLTWTALEIWSPGRFSPLGPRDINR
jgi:hypothetical protein